MNGEENDLVGQLSKRIKTEKISETYECEDKSSASNIRSQTAMVCSVSSLIDALKTQHQQQQHGEVESITVPTTTTSIASTTPKVTTAIMMDANSAKNLVSQLLAAAAAGQGRIEVGGTPTTHLAGEQALDMSVSLSSDGFIPISSLYASTGVWNMKRNLLWTLSFIINLCLSENIYIRHNIDSLF